MYQTANKLLTLLLRSTLVQMASLLTAPPIRVSRPFQAAPGSSTGKRAGRARRAPAAAAVAGVTAVAGQTSTFEEFLLDTQQRIIQATEALDGSGARFVHDRWERSPGNPNAGYGITSVLEGGSVLEKAAVNVSIVGGVLTPARAKAMSSRGREGIDPEGGQSYSAAAMSLVYHSAHPHIPTLRADVRVFDVAGQQWLGGGCDLTPFYVREGDFGEFHQFWRALCDRHGPQLYPEFKQWCAAGGGGGELRHFLSWLNRGWCGGGWAQTCPPEAARVSKLTPPPCPLLLLLPVGREAPYPAPRTPTPSPSPLQA